MPEMNEFAWEMEHSVDCDASPGFAWRFMTHVPNWSDPPAQFALEGPFEAGANGTTTMPGQASVHWLIRDVQQGESYTIETALDLATLAFEWRFAAEPERRTRLTQRIMLAGENASAYVEAIASSFGSNLPAGMLRVARSIAEAEALALRTPPD